MAEKKHLELRLEVKDITGAPTKDLTTHFEVSDQSQSISGKGQASIPLGSSVNAKSLLLIQLKSSEHTIGFTKVSLSTLFSESLSGKLDRFIKLKSEDFPNLRIKLAGFVSKTEVPKSKPVSVKSSSRRSSKSQKEVTCPYLENLANGLSDMAALNELWKYRDQDSHAIKISLEPGPGMLEPVDHSQVTEDQLEHLPGSTLRQVVKSICEEASQYSKISSDLPNKKEEFEGFIKSRRDLGSSSQAEIDSIKQEWGKFSEAYNELRAEKNSQSQVLIDKINENHELSKELDHLKSTLYELQREHHIVVNQHLQYSDSNQNKGVLLELIARSEKQKEELERKVLESKAGFGEALEGCMNKIQGVRNEVERIKLRTEEVNKEGGEARKENERIRGEILAIKERLGNEFEGMERMQNEFDRLFSEFSQRKGIIEAINRKVSQVNKENLRVLENFQELIDGKKGKMAQLGEMMLGIERKTRGIQETEKEILEEKIGKVSKEQVCCLRADLAQLSEDLVGVKGSYLRYKPDFDIELDKASSLLLVESEKVLVQVEKADRIIDGIDKKEEELEGLKDVMGQAQKRTPPYVPVKDDPVDVALGSYLNSKETPVPIKFIRQEGGNYTFGTKKIYIKIENSKLLIKVGGGFTNIDEFLWIYTPVELEKIDSSPRRKNKV